jgi:hypothetical protein
LELSFKFGMLALEMLETMQTTLDTGGKGLDMFGGAAKKSSCMTT